ncbi:hypothetical protein Q0Z83_056670 [Actinoplanes sichuanensis]|uniref:Uncharacterized protein n=1 Tax=Actinoplanes sichuanensis TaxID=512349 RepID=A0ABW4A5P7_9ACTN|nr:hypothetical protein [Actinoplanes sichuanensis]BEL07476.1 hypothetical protein Q0Z83_056670 [Actinoplanes sichuanensis]
MTNVRNLARIEIDEDHDPRRIGVGTLEDLRLLVTGSPAHQLEIIPEDEAAPAGDRPRSVVATLLVAAATSNGIYVLLLWIRSLCRANGTVIRVTLAGRAIEVFPNSSEADLSTWVREIHLGSDD